HAVVRRVHELAGLQAVAVALEDLGAVVAGLVDQAAVGRVAVAGQLEAVAAALHHLALGELVLLAHHAVVHEHAVERGLGDRALVHVVVAAVDRDAGAAGLVQLALADGAAVHGHGGVDAQRDAIVAAALHAALVDRVPAAAVRADPVRRRVLDRALAERAGGGVQELDRV